MSKKKDLVQWLNEALRNLGGRGTIPEACKAIWEAHEDELKDSGDLFYTWQYDVRWAAYQLRKAGVMKPDKSSPSGVWELA